jgi:uncharacterized membrane protein
VTDRKHLVSLLLAMAGIGVAAYLTYTHYNQGALACGIGDCETVQASKYARLLGIPVAVFGLAMYAGLLALLLLRAARPQISDVLTAAITAVLLAGTIYAAYLTYLEIWVIDAICQWCVTSAIITVLLLLVEGSRLINDYRGVFTNLDMEDE